MATDLEIANNAILLIGANQITGTGALANTTDTKREAVFARALYEQNKEWLLSAAIWNFAKKSDTITNNGAPQDNDQYSYTYSVPKDFVKLVRFNPCILDYSIFERQHIFANDAGPLKIEFIKSVDEEFWPEWFRATFEFFFASVLALPITRKPELSRELKNQFIENFEIVSVTNAEQVPTESFGTSPFIDVR